MEGESHLGIPIWSQEGQGFDIQLSLYSKGALPYPTLPYPTLPYPALLNPIQLNPSLCNPMVSVWSCLEIVQTFLVV